MLSTTGRDMYLGPRKHLDGARDADSPATMLQEEVAAGMAVIPMDTHIRIQTNASRPEPAEADTSRPSEEIRTMLHRICVLEVMRVFQLNLLEVPLMGTQD